MSSTMVIRVGDGVAVNHVKQTVYQACIGEVGRRNEPKSQSFCVTLMYELKSMIRQQTRVVRRVSSFRPLCSRMLVFCRGLECHDHAAVETWSSPER